MSSGGSARLLKAAVAVSIAAGTLLISLPTQATHSGQQAEQAARDIQDARDRANAASQAVFDAESRIDGFTIDIADAEKELAAVQAEADLMRSQLEDAALRSFVNSGAPRFALLIDLDAANDNLTGDRLAAVARGNAAVDLDEFEAVMHLVTDARNNLERRREEAATAKQQFADLKAVAEREITNLAAIERDRVIDAQVQHELDRQREAREAAARAAAAAQQASAASSSATTGGRASGGSTSQSPSGGASPARSNPAPSSPAPSNAGSGMVCPIAGPRAFSDTWGAPRSGGRSHEGVDMMSPFGTPLVAVESGQARFSTNNLGGNAIWLTSPSGKKYYYAHLSSYEGSSRSVSRGEVIGYIGQTGNVSVNSLHFEVHVGGRSVNPYPYVRAVC